MAQTRARQPAEESRIFRLGDILTESLYRRPVAGRPPVLLLAAGHRIDSERQLRQLRAEGYAVTFPAEVRLAGDRRAGATAVPTPPASDRRGAASEWCPEFALSLEAAARVHQSVVGAVRDLMARVGSGAALPMGLLEQASSALLAQVSSDAAAMVALTYLRRCDDYTLEHSANVAILMVAMARLLGVPEAELPATALAGLLHDVGKQRVPPHILNKAGTLTAAEFEAIRRHPLHGHDILAECAGCPEAARAVTLQHHERLDGGGYPGGLNTLLPCSRIAAVADTFDAMTSDRVYRRAGRPRQALFEINRERGTRLAPEAVDALIKLVGVYPVGSRVLLDSGESGTVVAPNPLDTTRPTVMIDCDALGRPVVPPRPFALAEGRCRIVRGEE